MKHIKSLIAILATVALVGCASFNSTVFYAEKTAADMGAGAVHTFNVHYAQTAPTASPKDLIQLNWQRDDVYAASRKLGATLAVTEAMRQNYATNSAGTNAAALQVALSASLDQSTNLVNLIKLYIGK